MYSYIEESINSVEVDRLYVENLNTYVIVIILVLWPKQEFQFHMGEIPESHSRLFM